MTEFGGKVVTITGGGGGIGKAAAARFLAEGASVVLSGRREEVLGAAQRELDPGGGRTARVAADAGSPGMAQRVIDVALERFGEDVPAFVELESGGPSPGAFRMVGHG